MFAIKGFISHAMMAKNVPGQNALIGELSTQALTYALEKGHYGHVDARDLVLTTFFCREDGTAKVLSAPLVQHVLGVANFVMTKVVAGNELFADELLVQLGLQYPTVTNFRCGAVQDDGDYWAPEWLSWTTAAGDQVKIWLIDSAFRSQYDEYEIVVVAPLDNLNDFFLAGGTVQNKLAERDTTDHTDRLQAAKGDHPVTLFRIYEFEYVNPLNAAHKLNTLWGVLVYGSAGDNIDSIKDALQAHILANSTYTKAQWTPILPDIFRRTEFVLVPRWDLYAIPNRSVEAGIHATMVNLTEALTKARAVVAGYPSAHINSHTSVFHHPYKSLAVLTVGSPENRDNLWKLEQVFEDYIGVPSTSMDFNRMSADTKGWVLMLDDMLLAAEELTEFTNVPLGMSKAQRDGVLYVVKSYQNVHYLVAAKASIDTEPHE